MALDPGLLEILACPDDKGPLRYFAAENILYNPRQGITYPIKDGIPVLLHRSRLRLTKKNDNDWTS